MTRPINPWEVCARESDAELVTVSRDRFGKVKRRRAVCNRAKGHAGPHTETRQRDFKKLAEWGP